MQPKNRGCKSSSWGSIHSNEWQFETAIFYWDETSRPRLKNLRQPYKKDILVPCVRNKSVILWVFKLLWSVHDARISDWKKILANESHLFAVITDTHASTMHMHIQYIIIIGISRCRSQHVSVESSSLFQYSIYLRFIWFPWWSIDELENLHADRTTVCFEPWQKPRARLGTRKTGLSPPVMFTDHSKTAFLLWFIFICYHIYSFAYCMTLWPL